MVELEKDAADLLSAWTPYLNQCYRSSQLTDFDRQFLQAIGVTNFS